MLFRSHEIWQDLPSLRELFLCQYTIPIDRLVAPNPIHIGLEQGEHSATVKSTLGMLRGCPLLETLLIVHSNDYTDQTRDHSRLSSASPQRRAGYVRGLFWVDNPPSVSPNVAVGFRMPFSSYIYGEITPSVMATIQHVLKRIDIRWITPGAPPDPQESICLVRFEGPGGSLEIITCRVDRAQLQSVPFRLASRTRGSYISSDALSTIKLQGLDHISAAMPNLVSISFFDCQWFHTFRSLTVLN